ncbi:TPA: ABC transporter ATP-binding protein [Candidatus Bipolaricaulota bacterium]|nr:ABC transporter ATP-binding protein [Candidatus Bipolaricaulota bacterium]
MEPVIEVQGLVKRYGEVVAVAGISFEVRRGEVFALLGPNGAGKTTTVECLEGLRVPDEGRVVVLEEVPSPTNYALKAKLGIQLQGTAFLPRLTVEETLTLFARLYPRRREVEELLELVALKGKRRSQVKDLSGGQRQRLAVALALVNDPELLILDEPTTGLDPQARRALWEVILGLKREEKTVLLTTHYMEEAEALCDRVAILDHGEIIALGSPEELVAENFRETPLELELSGPAPEVDFAALPGVVRAIQEDQARVVLYSTAPMETIQAVSALAGQGQGRLPLQDLTLRRASLEDLYLALTGRRIRE